MSRGFPEKPPDDSERAADAAWDVLGAELMGQDGNEAGVAAAKLEMREREAVLRKQEIQRHVFEIDDLLRRAPEDFPDRGTLARLISAIGTLVDPLLPQARESQARFVAADLTEALKLLRQGETEN